MDHLHQVIGAKVREWRERGYPCDEFPAITEILEYQVQSEEVSDGALADTLRFLREPQRRALERTTSSKAPTNSPPPTPAPHHRRRQDNRHAGRGSADYTETNHNR
jgi:hypothetical protein